MNTINEKNEDLATSTAEQTVAMDNETRLTNDFVSTPTQTLAENVVETAKKSSDTDENNAKSDENSAETDENETSDAEVLDDYQQMNNYKDALFNDLVGDFDEFGEYTISEDIMQELIDMPKKIDYIDDAGIHARGFFGDHTFAFLVTKPVELDNGDAYCYLRLDEQVDRMAGFQFETITSTIATYCYHFDKLFDGFVRDVFHLREYEGDDTGEEGRKYRAEQIANRYDLFYTMRACSEDYYEKLEEIYFNHRMLLLGMDPELTLIMAEFNKKRLKLDAYLIISRRRFFFLNQLLDEVLQMQAERLSKSEIAERMAQLDVKYIEKSKEIKQKTLENPKVKERLPKEKEKKSVAIVSNKKPAPAKTPKKGVSKGGGDKPKSKPKKKGGKSGNKDKAKKDNKPKTVAKAGPKDSPTPPQTHDPVLESFERGEGLAFGNMRM